MDETFTEEKLLEMAVRQNEELQRVIQANQILLDGILDSVKRVQSAMVMAARVMRGEPLPH